MIRPSSIDQTVMTSNHDGGLINLAIRPSSIDQTVITPSADQSANFAVSRHFQTIPRAHTRAIVKFDGVVNQKEKRDRRNKPNGTQNDQHTIKSANTRAHMRTRSARGCRLTMERKPMGEEKIALCHLTPKQLGQIIDLAMMSRAESYAADHAQDPWPLHEKRPLRVFRATEFLERDFGPFYRGSQLRALLLDLPEPALIELTALMWLGRGDGDWDWCLQHATENSNGPGDVGYVLGKPLEEYLPRALLRIAFLMESTK